MVDVEGWGRRKGERKKRLPAKKKERGKENSQGRVKKEGGGEEI